MFDPCGSTWFSSVVSANKVKFISSSSRPDIYNSAVLLQVRTVFKMTEPIITIEEGQLRGKKAEDYLGGSFYSFLGIPYAKAPVGELRFKAPVAVDPWDGVRDATKEGPESPARHMFFGYYTGSEDNCLNLNVYTRELPKGSNALKPVMVWIHGGGFLYGCNRSEFFGPEYLITEDIVLVSINYRLGVLGFLSLEDPSLEVPGNAGFKDMILALKWVQKNIQNFNGDPNNVTIFGESAGSASVQYLYLSPLSKGLFHKVIAQSGSALNCWARGRSNGKIIANDLGFKETDERKILEYLKTTSSQKIVQAQHKAPDYFTSDIVRPYGPVVEKASETAFLSEEPIEIIKAGKFNDVPLIMGYNSKEGIFFEAVRKIIPGAKLTTDFETEIPFELNLEKGSQKSKSVASKIEKFYFSDEPPTEKNVDNLYLLKTDNQFLHGIHRSIQYQKLTSKSPIYFYRMSLETPINYYTNICTSKTLPVLFLFYFLTYKCGKGSAKTCFLKLSRALPSKTVTGVCHADDLGYLFKSFLSEKLERGSIEEISVRRFVKLWTNFARTGNPTPDKNDQLLNNVEWQPVTIETNKFLDIGKELKTGTNPDLERMQFWDALYS